MSGIGVKFNAEGEREFKRALSEINQTYKVLNSEMKLVQSQFDKTDNSVGALTARNETLNKQIDAQKNKIATLKAALENAAASFGENDKRTNAWRIQLNNAEAALNEMERELKNNTAKMNEAAAAADDMGKEIEDSGKAAERSEGRFSGLGGVLKGIAGTMAAVTAAAGAAAVKIGKEVVTAYADYEQLLGGVETLFGAGGQSLEEYAKSVGKSTKDAKKEFEQLEKAQETVVGNARDAFKTAGLSANEYMETVTGFSASLIQSLGGDTEKAASYADRAITDMSDNANKMGTDISSIQNAYQGFAKQNYTMLDNLKLGYGGTKEEMARLIEDASKMTDVQKELGVTVEEGNMSFANIVNAISVMQEQMGIAGTTSKEAMGTISGSVDMAKSAFENFVTGLGDKNADLKKLTGDMVISFQAVVKNIQPVIQNLAASLPEVAESLLGAAEELLPTFLETAENLVVQVFNSISESLPEILPQLFDTILSLLDTIFTDGLPTLLDSIMKVAGSLLDSFLQKFPELLNKLITFIGSIDLGELLNQFLGAVEKIAAMIAENLPTIVENLVNAVINLVRSIDWGQLIESGNNILLSLLDGILSAIPALIDALPQLIDAIIDFLTDPETVIKLVKGAVKLVFKLIEKLPEIFMHLISAIANIGIKLIEGLWDGIKKAGSWLWEKITGFFGGIVDGIKGFFGIHSPSTLFRDEIGKNLALGLGEGFDDEMKRVSKDMQNAVPTDFDTQIQAAAAMPTYNFAYGNAAATGGNNYNQTFNVSLHVDSISDSMDINDVVSQISEQLAQEVRRRENVYT